MDLTDEQIELLKDAELGIEMRAFLGSPAGQHLFNRAKADLEQAKDEWYTLNPYVPEDQQRMMEIKLMLTNTPLKFIEWCAEAIHSGNEAEEQLKELEEE